MVCMVTTSVGTLVNVDSAAYPMLTAPHSNRNTSSIVLVWSWLVPVARSVNLPAPAIASSLPLQRQTVAD